MTAFSSSCGKTTSGLVHVEAGSDITSEALSSRLCLEGGACSGVRDGEQSPNDVLFCYHYEQQ